MSDNTSRHILGNFEAALENLRSNVLMMASLTERGMENARKGLLQRDSDLCGVTIADDEEIDALEVQIDQAGIETIMKFQPVASDMREIIAAMKMSGNIERVADQAVSIARRARKLNRHNPLPELDLLQPMYHSAQEMFRDAVKAYAEMDQTTARGMKERDRELDALNKSLADKFADCMAQHREEIRGYLNLIFIARFLERIGDHATNMCEDVVYICAAEDIRHTAPKPEA